MIVIPDLNCALLHQCIIMDGTAVVTSVKINMYLFREGCFEATKAKVLLWFI